MYAFKATIRKRSPRKDKFLKEKQEAKLFFEFFQTITKGVESIEKQYNGKIDQSTIENHKSKGKSEEIARRMILRYAKASKTFDLPAMKKDLNEGANSLKNLRKRNSIEIITLKYFNLFLNLNDKT